MLLCLFELIFSLSLFLSLSRSLSLSLSPHLLFSAPLAPKDDAKRRALLQKEEARLRVAGSPRHTPHQSPALPRKLLTPTDGPAVASNPGSCDRVIPAASVVDMAISAALHASPETMIGEIMARQQKLADDKKRQDTLQQYRQSPPSQTPAVTPVAVQSPLPDRLFAQPSTFTPVAVQSPLPNRLFAQPSTYTSVAVQSPLPDRLFAQPSTYTSVVVQSPLPDRLFAQPSTYTPVAVLSPQLFTHSPGADTPSTVTLPPPQRPSQSTLVPSQTELISSPSKDARGEAIRRAKEKARLKREGPSTA